MASVANNGQDNGINEEISKKYMWQLRKVLEEEKNNGNGEADSEAQRAM